MDEILKKIPIVAVLPLIEGILTQLKAIKKRRDWVQEKTHTFGSLGGTHWAIDNLSILISNTVAAAAIISSWAFLATQGLGVSKPPAVLKPVLDWNDSHYGLVLLVWLLHTILAHTNGITRLLWGVVWLVPPWRSRLGFTNARWHIRQGEKAPAIALTREQRQKIPGDITNSLVSSPANANLALRPTGMTDAEAANVLFIGHVIECAMTGNNVRWNADIWTSFYQALSAVAKSKDRPFTPEAIGAFSGTSFFQEVVMRLDQHRPADLPAPPQDYEIPARVDGAQRLLASRFKGDARNLGRRLIGYSYDAYLANSRQVPQLALEEMRRQFAKLAIMWRITSKAHYPKEFKIPFSRHMAIYFLDKAWLRTDATSINVDDIYFLNAFDVAETRLVATAAHIIDTANDTPTKNWRDAQKHEASKLGLDWGWYLRYRIDQHVYHLARAASSAVWRTGDKSIERAATTAMT